MIDPDRTGEAPYEAPPLPRLTLTVVVCSYTMGRWSDLVAAVRSLQQQRRPAEEVLLVVDHCPELAVRAAGVLAGVRVVANRERPGLSGARNTGVALAQGEVVAFLDDDATADPDWTEQLMAAYRDPRVLGVGGLVRPRWEIGRPSWFPPEFDWVVGCSYRGMPEQGGPVRNFIGANMSFRRAELVAAGGFRPDLGRVGNRPLGCEETELCIRLAAGRPEAELRYEPAAGVSHRVPEGRTNWAYFRSRCYAEGLSKAVVARHTGRGPALACERRYLRSVIPRGMARSIGPRGGGPRELFALTLGVTATLTGYATGRLREDGTLGRLVDSLRRAGGPGGTP
ncbi:glycosyltransferase family 2 protein [Kitasatospora sp. NPDC002040]|uniref:glycosyltransferase family 2 protein n=1 Tax=Kitasatospora sp. NPDC002040 TaxID=3154661 RepID=UPI00331D5259